MRGGLHPLWVLAALIFLIVTGVGILVFLTTVPPEAMTSAHEALLAIGDWIIKVSVGAILGLGGSRLVPARSNGA